MIGRLFRWRMSPAALLGTLSDPVTARPAGCLCKPDTAAVRPDCPVHVTAEVAQKLTAALAWQLSWRPQTAAQARTRRQLGSVVRPCGCKSDPIVFGHTSCEPVQLEAG